MRAIEIFCQSDEHKYHQDLAKCLSDAAFKAVDEIVKVYISICVLFKILNFQNDLYSLVEIEDS